MCENKKEEKDMATKALDTNFTLNESEAMEIIRAPRRMIKESKIFNDIKLSRDEKIKHASNILNSRK
jgi:hypothetical protein